MKIALWLPDTPNTKLWYDVPRGPSPSIQATAVFQARAAWFRSFWKWDF